MFRRIFEEFRKVGLTYAIIGGVAVNLHGFLRATADLDIVILLTDDEIKKFIKAVKNLGMIPRVPVKIEEFAQREKRKEWIEEKNMLVFSVYNPTNHWEHIDVKISGEEEFSRIIKNRVLIGEGGIELPVASIDDIIKLKMEAGRERDFIDIKALKKIKDL